MVLSIKLFLEIISLTLEIILFLEIISLTLEIIFLTLNIAVLVKNNFLKPKKHKKNRYHLRKDER